MSQKDAENSGSLHDTDSEYDEDDEDFEDYYNNNDDDLDSEGDGCDDFQVHNGQGDNMENNNVKKLTQDLDYFEYECLSHREVDEKLQGECASLASKLKVTCSVARIILQAHHWKTADILQKAISEAERNKLLVKCGVCCATPPAPLPILPSGSITKTKEECGVCLDSLPRQRLAWLPCTHAFCKDCWTSHIEQVINEGLSDGIQCMAKDCHLYAQKDFAEQFLGANSKLADMFQKRHRSACVTSHYNLRFCPGADCKIVFYAMTPKARRVKCRVCHTVCCFDCGNIYHSPTDCDTIKKWLTKCADDSETANYICANTKSCPKCLICIEKNGGCNHIRCSKCKYDFCWMCLSDWKNHHQSYYECSKFKENPLIAEKNQESLARDALKKYLFYFDRWENHNKSLRLEDEARKRIHVQIEENVSANKGTWIDWQYLLRAGELLAKCRLTLQNTYPLAYYSPPGAEKALFEYQQAQLELEIEELSWKLENAESYQRGDIENQMDVAAKRRHTLLSHFMRD